MDEDGVKREQTNLRLAIDIKARLDADARRNRRSMTAHMEYLIDTHTPPLEDVDAPVAS